MAIKPNPVSTPLAAVQQNLAMRRMLLASGGRFRKVVSTVSAAMGSTARLELQNVGITVGAILRLRTTVDIGVAVGVPSVNAPYNVISAVRLKDFDGQDRINASGVDVAMYMSQRFKRRYGFPSNGVVSPATVQSSIAPKIPTAIGNGQAYEFYLRLPIAVDPYADLSGAILTQSNLGNVRVEVDLVSAMEAASASFDADNPYAFSATGTFTNPTWTIDLIQEYLVPNPVGGMTPIPKQDLLTVHELVGLYTETNLQANTDALISYPSVRSVIGSGFRYINNGAQNPGTDISRIKLVANANNILVEDTAETFLYAQREKLNMSDLPSSWYLNDHSDRPVETNILGNVQEVITPSVVTAGATTRLSWWFASLYQKGTVLPGIVT